MSAVNATRQDQPRLVTHAPLGPPSLEDGRRRRRGRDTADRHADGRRSCGGLSLVGVNGNTCGVYPLPCKRWECPHCGLQKRKRTQARILAGLRLPGTYRFVTLTSPAGDDPATSFRLVGRRWKRLHLRLVRRFGTIEYIAVVEAQPRRGVAHIHLVYRGPYIPQAWWSRAAAGAGFGRIVHARSLPHGIAGYLTKDLARPTGWGMTQSGPTIPPHVRRVRWSVHWCPWTKPTLERRWTTWWIADAPPPETARSARQRNLAVVEFVPATPATGRRGAPVYWYPAGHFGVRPYHPPTPVEPGVAA